MQTKGAIGNLINRYRAVLKKCNLLNTFGTLAIASAIAMSGVGVAGAVDLAANEDGSTNLNLTIDKNGDVVTTNNGGTFVIDSIKFDDGEGTDTSAWTLGSVTIGDDAPASGEKANVTHVTFKDSVGADAVEVVATNANAAMVIDGNSTFTATGLTLTGVDAVAAPGFEAPAKVATLDIKQGSTFVMSNTSGANVINGAAGGSKDNQIVNVAGKFRSDNAGAVQDLTIGNTGGIQFNVAETGRVEAKELTVANGSELKATDIYVSANDNHGTGVAATEFTISAGGKVVADNVDINADFTNSVNTVSGNFGLVADKVIVKGGTVALGNADIGTLTLNQDYTHSAGKLVADDLQGTKDLVIGAAAANATVSILNDTVTLAHGTAVADNSKQEVFFGSNGGSLTAKGIKLSGYDGTTSHTKNLGGSAAIEISTEKLDLGFIGDSDNTLVADAINAGVDITILSQNQAAEGEGYVFLTNGNLILDGNTGNASLTLGSEEDINGNAITNYGTYKTDSTITLSGNANSNSTIIAQYGDWTVEKVEVADDKNGTIAVDTKGKLTVKDLTVDGSLGSSAQDLQIKADNNGQFVANAVTLVGKDNSNKAGVTVDAENGSVSFGSLDMSGDNASVTVSKGTLTVTGEDANKLQFGTGTSVTVGNGATFYKKGDFTIDASKIANGSAVSLNATGTFKVDNLTLGETAGDQTLAAVGTVEANTLAINGSSNTLNVQGGTLKLLGNGVEENAYTGGKITVTGNNSSSTTGIFELAGNGGKIDAEIEVTADNTSNGTLKVTEGDWTVGKFTVDASNNALVTVANSTLTVDGALKVTNNASSTTTGINVQNLGTLAVSAANVGLEDFDDIANEIDGGLVNTVLVDAGGTFKLTGLNNQKLTVDQINAIKSNVMTGNGLLQLDGADFSDLNNADGTVDYVAGITAEEFKDKLAFVDSTQSSSALSGGYAGLKFEENNIQSFAVNGTLQLTGATGVLAQSGERQDLDVNVADNSALTLGGHTTAGSGSLGDINLAAATSKLNAVNGTFTLGEINGANGSVVVSNAELTTQDINVASLETDSNINATGNVTVGTALSLKDGAVITAVKAENETEANITVTNGIAGSGKLVANDGTITLSAVYTGAENDKLVFEGKNFTASNNVTSTADNSAITVNVAETASFAQLDAKDDSFTAGRFAAAGAVELDGSVMTAKGGVTDANGAALANDFQNNFTAENGSVVNLGGVTKFGDGSASTVAVQYTGVMEEGKTGTTSVIIDSLAAESNGTFTAEGTFNKDNNIDTVAFLQVKDVALFDTVTPGTVGTNTFETKTNGLISLGGMGIEAMKYEIGMAEDAARLAGAGNDFRFNSAVAIAEKDIDLTNIGISAGGTATQGNLNVAKDNLLIADVSSLKSLGAPAAKADEPNALVKNGTVSIDEGAGVRVVGANAKAQYVLADNAAGSTIAASDKLLLSSGNRLVSIDSIALGEDTNADKVIISTGLNSASTVFGGKMDASLAALLDSYAVNGGNNAFLAYMLDATKVADAGAAANAIESAAKAPMVVGAPTTALSVATMGADYAMARTSFAPRVAGAAAVAENGEYTNISAGDNMANGMNLWIMPMYQNSKVDGLQSGSYELGFDSDFTGVAVGADYTWANSFRLGATVNMGTGSSESKGALAYTENDYDSVGVGIYAGYMIGNLGLSADVNYTNISNEISQRNIGGALSADGDTNVWSVGVRAEYKIAAEMMDIVPHIGLRYSNISIDAMNFSGVLTADADSANVWQMPIGVTFAKDIVTESGWTLTPSLDLSIIPAFGDTEMAQTVQFTGVNGIASMNSEIMDSVSGRAQVGIEVSKDQFYMGLDYAYQGSSNMDTHGVQATFGFKF